MDETKKKIFKQLLSYSIDAFYEVLFNLIKIIHRWYANNRLNFYSRSIPGFFRK